MATLSNFGFVNQKVHTIDAKHPLHYSSFCHKSKWTSVIITDFKIQTLVVSGDVLETDDEKNRTL